MYIMFKMFINYIVAMISDIINIAITYNHGLWHVSMKVVGSRYPICKRVGVVMRRTVVVGVGAKK